MPTYKTRLILTDYTEYANEEEATKAAMEWALMLSKSEMCDVDVADIQEEE